ncbi:MAG TPA: glycosyltransferase family 2 protein [Patescibacteria group bacterium]
MKISIVILHFGDISVTQKCVRSLKNFETEKFSLIIVNNTTSILSKKDFPGLSDVVVINNEKNLGFAGGVNKGIRYSLYKKMDSVMLLNNDTKINKSVLKVLAPMLDDKNIGIVAPRISFEKDGKKTSDLGGHITMPFGKTYHTEISDKNVEISSKIDYVSGCCMLIKRKVFEKIGLFDDRFFLYYEDVDFCLRAKKAGFGIKVYPQVVIQHELSKSAGKMSKLSIYNQIKSAALFGKKYFKGSKRIPNVLFVFFQTLLFFKASPINTIRAITSLKFLL